MLLFRMISLAQLRFSPNPSPLPVSANSLSLSSPITGFPNTNLSLFTLLRTLLHFFALTKNATPCFQLFPHSGSKNTGGGGTPLSGVQPLRGDCHAPNQSPVTSHQSPLWPSVPLQPNALGATIGNSARKLHDPGKQLRSPRCLTILSGHRELFDDVPGYTSTQSGSQVVPGSIVLTLDHSRVTRVIHPCRMVR